MISFTEALRTILETVQPLPLEERPLIECLGFGLREDLVARVDNPVFDNSAVDGYGVCSGAAGVLRLSGVSAAGGELPRALATGEAVRILTGAPVPDGVDAVVMQEDVHVAGGSVTLTSEVGAGDHIRRQGEEYRVGDTLVGVGAEITPAILGLLAANGIARLSVPRRPSVAVVVTGDELAQVGEKLGPSQIYESNGIGLRAAAQSCGARVSYNATVRDEPGLQATAFLSAASAADVVVISGGMSVGDRDHARSVLGELGMEEHFWRIRMRPGKPVLFGMLQGKPVFGLPGNPVSSLVTFHLLVRPALRTMLGIEHPVQTWRARLAEAVTKPAGRADFQRGLVEASSDGMNVRALDSQGSHRSGGLAVADCLIYLPEERTAFSSGEIVEVIPLA